MIKRLLTPLLVFTSLYAEEIEEVQPLNPEVAQSLYVEAALFVAVFAIMSIISIIISKKHAAQNLLNDQKEREAKKSSQAVSISEPEETERVAELSKMLKDGLITDDEFKILSKASKVKSQ